MKTRKRILLLITVSLSVLSCYANPTKVEVIIEYTNSSEKLLVDSNISRFEVAFPTEGKSERIKNITGLEKLRNLKEVNCRYLDSSFLYSCFDRLASLEVMHLESCELNSIAELFTNRNLKALIIQDGRIKNVSEMVSLRGVPRMEYIELRGCSLNKPIGFIDFIEKKITLNYAINEIKSIDDSYLAKYFKVILYGNPVNKESDESTNYLESVPEFYRKYE